MQYFGPITQPEDLITKKWITDNLLSLIQPNSITSSMLDSSIFSSQMTSIEVSSPALTKLNNIFTWIIPVTSHGISSKTVSVIVYDNSDDLVACDVNVASDYTITIKFQDDTDTTSIDAGTYRAVIIGRGQNVTIVQDETTGDVTIL